MKCKKVAAVLAGWLMPVYQDYNAQLVMSALLLMLL